MRRFWLAALALGAVLIAWASLSYATEGELHPFLLEKEGLRSPELYRAALYLHVVSATASLAACVALFSRRLLRALPRAHRALGRLTGLALLLAATPSGAYLSLEAKGGPLGTLGFLVTGGIVFAALIASVRAARAGDYPRHRRMSLHVLTQLGVAVASRAMLLAFDHLGVPEDPGYLVALWVPVLGGAIAAELIARRFKPILSRRVDHVARTRPLVLGLARR